MKKPLWYLLCFSFSLSLVLNVYNPFLQNYRSAFSEHLLLLGHIHRGVSPIHKSSRGLIQDLLPLITDVSLELSGISKTLLTYKHLIFFPCEISDHLISHSPQAIIVTKNTIQSIGTNLHLLIGG